MQNLDTNNIGYAAVNNIRWWWLHLQENMQYQNCFENYEQEIYKKHHIL